MPNKKHYLITAITLGAIAAASAVLIASANLITKKRIEKNEENRFNAGIAAIFGENVSTVSFATDVKIYDKTDDSYIVHDAEDKAIGWAVLTTGKNMYGKISLIAGFDYNSKTFKSIYVVTNEQTYASTLVDNYIDPLNKGDVKLDDVSCGATYGAKLIRDMVNAAQSYVDGIIID